jgi:hypothetical protein
MFTPFVNPNFENQWHEGLVWTVDGIRCTQDEYIKAKDVFAGVRETLLPVSSWWANAHILCNVMPREVWGDSLFREYHDFLVRVCHHRSVPDVEFFLNKRDFPQVRADRTHPYSFLFPGGNATEEVHTPLLPVFSAYTSSAYVDVPFLSAADLETAASPPDHNAIPWDMKTPTAFFRGAATGPADPERNVRMRLASLSQLWDHTPPLLDAALTTWNIRDKVSSDGVVAFTPVHRVASTMRVGKQYYVPLADQLQFKYLLYVDGHSAANRMSFLLASGCLVLRVKSDVNTTAPNLWFMHLLTEWIHYVPVSADLSNLRERVQWCRDNDDECRSITFRAREFWEAWLCDESLMEYTAYVLHRVASRRTLHM